MAIFQAFERPRSHSKALDLLIGKAYADARLTQQEKAVLICLAWHAKNRAGEAYPSQATVAKLTGVCISLVGRALKALVTYGYIEKADRHRKDGGRTSSLIVIHGMQFFPEDRGTSLKPELQTTSAVTSVPTPHTNPSRTAYRPMKQESLKQDSSSHLRISCNVEEREAFFSNFTKTSNPTQADCISTPKPPPTEHDPQVTDALASFLPYLMSNRQSLTESDMKRLADLESRLDGLRDRGLTARSEDRSEIEKTLSAFFEKRTRTMEKPTKEQLDTIIDGLQQLPADLVRVAVHRVDEIYKPSWRIPPRLEHFLATVKDERRTSVLIRNALVAFADAKRLYAERQRQRGLMSAGAH